MSGPTHMSAKGVQFVAGWEGFRPGPYNDLGGGKGNCTIGYGHLLHMGVCTHADREKWGTIDRGRASVLLAHDLREAEATVSELVRPPFSLQHRFDALVSFVFNVGPGQFAGSHLLQLLNTDWRRRGAADELLKWDHAGGVELPGLLNRRKAERRLFLYGLYG